MTRNAFIFVGTFLVAIALGTVFYLYSRSAPSKGQPQAQSSSSLNTDSQSNIQAFQGTITETSTGAGTLTVRAQNGDERAVAVDASTRFYDRDGKSVDLSYLRRGWRVNAVGVTANDSSILATEVRVLAEPNIIVFFPEPDQIVGLPLHVKGDARVFESALNFRLRDEDGTVLVEGMAMAKNPDANQYGSFDISSSYPRPQGVKGTVEVFDYSAKDGSEIDKIAIPVRFAGDQPSMDVKAYFPNRKKNPDAEDCGKVYPVSRRIARAGEPARAALEELLSGPTREESDGGYFTSLNFGTKLLRLSVQGRIAQADFDDMLVNAVGGSCRVQTIRSEITQTLKQFSSIRSVVISVNGRTEDVLQP